MKYLRKIVVCMLAVVMLNTQIMPCVEAAETQGNTVAAQNEMEQTKATPPSVTSQKNGIIVVFIFSYVDGSSASLVSCSASVGTVTITKNTFSGDSRIVEAVVTVGNKQTTFGAWCDVYGQTGSF